MRLPSGTGFCTATLVLDAHTFLVGCGGWYGGSPGIYRSTDTGQTWRLVSGDGVVGQALVASDGTLYWAGHQQGGLLRSADRGVTWVSVASSQQAKPLTPVELPGGRIVTVGAQRLMLSADRGATRSAIGKDLPFQPNGLAYSATRRAFYVTHFTCSSPVPNDGVMRFGFE